MPNRVDFPPNPGGRPDHPNLRGLPDLPDLGAVTGDGRQPILAWAGRLDGGMTIGPYAVARGQLAFCFDGVMRVEIGEDRWFIPDRHGIWIPPGQVHRVTTGSPVEMQTFRIHPRHAARAGMPEGPTMVRATPLMRGIARRLAPWATNALTPAERRRLAWVAFDEMARLERADLRLPGARDARVAAAMAHLLTRPQDAQNLARLADRVGSSERTLSRLFQAETGLSWREWRDRMRFMLALEGVQEGMSSTALAARLGYSNTSAFVAAFRRRAGVPPSEWLRQS